MVVKRTDYTADAVEAARSVLLELTHLLGEYHDGIVIVGGWVPDLLFSAAGQRHIGSLDVDVALDHQMLQEADIKPSCSSYFRTVIAKASNLLCSFVLYALMDEISRSK